MGLSRLKLLFVVLACISGVVCAFNLTEDCPNDCYADWDQGQCNSATGTCECLTGLYTGDDCSIPHDTTNDWDNIDCHGGRLYPPSYNYGYNRYCLCPPGWLGVDCSVCASDTGCGNRNPNSNFTQVCDNSYFITTYKNFNCSVILDPSYGPFIGYNVPAVAASVSFPPNQTSAGIANLTFYLATTGTPILFFCNFSGCDYTLDSTGKLTIDCVATTCSTTTWSQASAISGAVSNAEGWMKLECLANQTCVWTQNTITNNFGAPFNLQCYPGECVDGPPDIYQSPIKDYTKMLIIISIGVGIILIFCFGSIGAYYLLRNHVYMDPPPFSTITLSFQNIRCTIPTKDGPRTILHSVSGAMQPGSITAIMGASGAGKTTFLDILSGRKNTGNVTGEVYLNDSPRDMRTFKRLSGYVMQDDVFMGTLTVREYLKYVALLRLPAAMSKEQKFARVDECLKDLNISHIRDSRIGTDTSRGISGGERKRLAIAAELVVDPSILLLDEPTSGLDSHSATTLIKTLHDLAHGAKKRTIIMSIHQPRSDIYHLFDYLTVFAFGQAAYQGRADEALHYFSTLGYECPEHFNPADFIIDTVSLPRFKEILPPASQYSINAGAKMGSVATVDEYASSFATQFRVLVHRSFVQYLRNPFLLRAQYSLHIIVGAMLGRLYWHVSNDLSHGGMQNRMGSLFFLVCLLSFGSITSIDLFFSERLLFLRERANGCYRTSAYFLAKAVSDIIPMRVIPPIILGSIVYYMIGFQHNTLKFFLFLAFLVLVSVSSTSMCFLISSIAPSIAFGNFLAILLLFFFLLFGGFLISLNSMPHWFMWVTYLSFMRYSYTGLMVNEFVGILILINPGDMGDDNPITITGTLLLDQVGIHPDMLYPALGGLCAIIAFFLFFTHLALHFVREKR